MTTGGATPDGPRPADEPADASAARAFPRLTRDLGAFGIDGADWQAQAARALGTQGAGASGLGQLAGYDLVRIVARGAQGTVYEAREPRSGRRVAIKQLRLADDDPRELLRLARETSALAGFSHPNIVSLLAAPGDDGSRALVLEWIEGRTFDEWAAEAWRTLAPGEAVRAIVRAAEGATLGIAAAHARGVAHRDLKPANVLVTDEGVPKVLDFGIALELGVSQSARTTTFAGTPSWAAPEQVSGPLHAIDHRVDVHALGLLLAQALSGVAPFDPRLPIEALFRAIAHEAVAPPSRARRGIPRELDLIVAHATAKDPAARYQTASALADDLGRFLRGEPIVAHPPDFAYAARKFVRRHPIGTTASIAAVLALATTSIVAVQLAIAAQRARDTAIANAALADEERDRVDRMNGFFRSLLAEVREHEGAEGPASARDLVAIASARLASEDLAPQSEATLHETLLEAYAALGDYRAAIAEADQALALLAPDAALDRARILEARGNAANRVGRGALALESLEASLASLDAHDAAHPERPAPASARLAALDSLVDTHRKANRLVEARAAMDEALRISERGTSTDRARMMALDAFLTGEEGDQARAAELAAAAVAFSRESADVEPLVLGAALHHAGTIAARRGQHEVALALLSECVTVREAHREAAAPIMNTRGMIALTLKDLGRLDEAIRYLDGLGALAGAPARLRNRTLGVLLVERARPEDLDRAHEVLVDGAGHFLGIDSGAALLASSQLRALGALASIEDPDGELDARFERTLRDFEAQGSDPLFAPYILGEMADAAHERDLRRHGVQARPIDAATLAAMRTGLERFRSAGRGETAEALCCEGFLGRFLLESGDAASRQEGAAILRHALSRAERLLGPRATIARRLRGWLPNGDTAY